MTKTFSAVAAAELVRHIGDCVDNLKSALEIAADFESALFFPAMMYQDEIYAQPLVIPIELANKMMAIILRSDHLEDADFVQYVVTAFEMMRTNARTPAPVNTHIKFLEVFERMAHDGMVEKSEEVKKLAALRAGDLVVMQFEVEELQLFTGLRIVSDPLNYFVLAGQVAPHSNTVH